MGTNRPRITAFPPVLVEELVRARQMIAIQQASHEGRLVLGREDPLANEPTNEVVHIVADDSRRAEDRCDTPGVQDVRASQSAGREQERIAREKRRHDEAGLGENDGEEQAVNPRAVCCRHSCQVLVEMEKNVDQRVHGSSRLSHGLPNRPSQSTGRYDERGVVSARTQSR